MRPITYLTILQQTLTQQSPPQTLDEICHLMAAILQQSLGQVRILFCYCYR